MLIFFLGCTQVPENKLNLKSAKDIEIVNKTTTKYRVEEIHITNKIDVDEIVKKLLFLKKISDDTSVKSYEGYFDLKISFENGEFDRFYVIKTYQGIVIKNAYTSKRFKDDQLYETIQNFFN